MTRSGADDGATYAATYIEASRTSADRAAALLQRHGEASHTGGGFLRFEVLQRRDRPAHFAILAAWRDETALHESRAEEFRAAVSPLLVSPPDERLHQALSIGPPSPASAPGALYVVTHIDVIPPQKDGGAALLERLAEGSRGHAANLRFEVWRQTSRPNHFTVVEVWADLTAFEAHAMTAAAREFRERLAPMSGSLYDERLYAPLDAISGGAESVSRRLETP
jgi:quinol monooxygenase YgiN